MKVHVCIFVCANIPIVYSMSNFISFLWCLTVFSVCNLQCFYSRRYPVHNCLLCNSLFGCIQVHFLSSTLRVPVLKHAYCVQCSAFAYCAKLSLWNSLCAILCGSVVQRTASCVQNLRAPGRKREQGTRALQSAHQVQSTMETGAYSDNFSQVKKNSIKLESVY